MKNKLIEEILIALSLSNLLFIAGWRRLLYPTSAAYHIKLEPYPLDYLGILLSVLLAAGILWGGLRISRLINKGKTPIIAKLFFLGSFVVILNGIRLQFYESESGLYIKITIFLAGLLIGTLILLKWRAHIFPFVRSVVLILSPFILITFSQAFWGMLTAEPKDETPLKDQLSAIGPKEKPEVKNRLVWIIFDEMDYFVPFAASPPPVDLPEFERLKNESVFATAASSPAYATLESIPSLITGKTVKKSATLGKNELMLRFADSETAGRFSRTPNIFSKIKDLGGETALVGWYHSYCRTIGKSLSACQWESIDTINDFGPRPLSRIVLRHFTNCLVSLPFGFRLFETVNSGLQAGIEDTGYVERHYRILEGAKAVISNPQVDLALIHLTVPHSPSYFNRLTGKFETKPTTYVDNLALADMVLGELRNTLEDKDLWNSSTVIVSTDHQWRLNRYKPSPQDTNFALTQGIEHPNIPFFLKLKNQKGPLIYEKPFNTVITHDLILALMKGEVATAEDAKNWLDKNSG